MNLRREPLQFYVDKIEREEVFASFLWGDGEFIAGTRPGARMQNEEIVTNDIHHELRSAIQINSSQIIHGTEPFLVSPETYGGQDKHVVNSCAHRLQSLLKETGSSPTWYDGTIWDTASRDGNLGPLIKVLKTKNVHLISSLDLYLKFPFKVQASTTVPARNACAQLNGISARIQSLNLDSSKYWVHLVCVGISAIPLINRLRLTYPTAAFLDLGSVFDVFAQIGAERGWRQELYADEGKWSALIEKHLASS